MTTTASPYLERFFPLAEAAKRAGLSEDTLRQLVELGKIRGAMLPNGDIAVSEQDAREAAAYERVNEQLRRLHRKDFRKWQGQAISISQATEEYDIPGMTLRGWIKRGYVTVLESGYGMTLDRADVAYCVAVYRIRKPAGIFGVPLLDDEGQPYLLKRPELGDYRRKKKLADRPNGHKKQRVKSNPQVLRSPIMTAKGRPSSAKR
jgi:hypothetical protein